MIMLAAFALWCPAQPLPQESTQLITVIAPTSRATVATARIWTRAGECWARAGGPYVARVGRNGVRTDKREGDGATPAGTFTIASRMYGNSADPGVRFPYVRLRCGDWWVEDVRSPLYNTFQRIGCGRRPPFKITTPDMSASPRAYAHLAVVEYNMHPVVRGRGSGIFVHVQIGKPTSGCISLRYADLVHVLRWLAPATHAMIRISVAP